MKAIKILTTAAVAGALVATAVAGPASAADIPVTVQPTIITNVGSVDVAAYTESAPITVNTSAGSETDVTGWVTHNGATFNTGTVYQDATGNASYDVISEISGAVFAYGDVEPGDYSVYFTSAQDTDSDYAYPDSTVTTYLPAQSAPVAVKISKLVTNITGWKTKSKSAKHAKFVKLSSPTLINAGKGTRFILEYKKKGSKTWHTSEAATVPSSGATNFKLTTYKFNTIKGKIAKRGTYYFRVTVKSSAFVTGDSTKQVKVTWK